MLPAVVGVLQLPGEDAVAQSIFDGGGTPNPTAIHRARRQLSEALAWQMQDDLGPLYASCHVPGPYTPDASAAGRQTNRRVELTLVPLTNG